MSNAILSDKRTFEPKYIQPPWRPTPGISDATMNSFNSKIDLKNIRQQFITNTPDMISIPKAQTPIAPLFYNVYGQQSTSNSVLNNYRPLPNVSQDTSSCINHLSEHIQQQPMYGMAPSSNQPIFPNQRTSATYATSNRHDSYPFVQSIMPNMSSSGYNTMG